MSRRVRFVLAVAATVVASGNAFARPDDAHPTGVPEDSIAHYLPYDEARASMAAAGVNYGLHYLGEYFDVTSGGQSRGSTYNGLVEGIVDFDLEKIAGWKGAVVHANVYYVHGEGPTEKTGSIFAVSNIEGLEAFRLDELWLEQSFADDRVKLKFGAIAADTEFFTSDASSHFINGTFGWAGILASNMIQGGPAYPLTSMGVRVEFNPNDDLNIRAAVFNGSPANPFAADPQRDNRHGTDFRFGDGQLLIAEGAYHYHAALEGTIKLGGWAQINSDTGVYSDFRTGAPEDGTHGLYAIVDQQIWKNGDDQSVNVFGRISGSPENKSLMDFYFDTGIVFTGFVPGRKDDSFGAAFGYGKISDDFRAFSPDGPFSSHESVLEINYAAHVASGVLLVPDFQYFWNPGVDPEVDHAAVFGLRADVHY